MERGGALLGEERRKRDGRRYGNGEEREGELMTSGGRERVGTRCRRDEVSSH